MSKLYVFVGIVCYVGAQEYLEDKHKNNFQTHKGPLNEIPKRFEIKGANAKAEFNRYVQDIAALAERDNVTVKYKVKVELSKIKTHNNKKGKKIISKKYNVPLKKRSMKLSSYELMQRKLFDEKMKLEKRTVEQVVTTPRKIKVFTTKPPSSGKYKPIIGSVKTNYTKIIKPVRNTIITLTE